jgi:CheY-like chemotaxis protein
LSEAVQEQPWAWLLDDNLLSATRLEPQLARLGYRVRTARSVPKDGDAPQLVVINLGSRTLDGIALISICKQRFPGSRVIGICGHLEVDIRRAAKAAGCDKILTNEQALVDLGQALAKF